MRVINAGRPFLKISQLFKRGLSLSLSLFISLFLTACLSDDAGTGNSLDQSSSSPSESSPSTSAPNENLCTDSSSYQSSLSAQAFLQNPKVRFKVLENKKWLGDKFIFDGLDELNINDVHLEKETLKILYIYFPHRKADFKNIGISMNGYRGIIAQAGAFDYQVIGSEKFSPHWNLGERDCDDEFNFPDIDHRESKNNIQRRSSRKFNKRVVSYNKKHDTSQKTKNNKNSLGQDSREVDHVELIQVNIHLEKFVFGGQYSAADIIREANQSLGRVLFKIYAPHGIVRAYSADLALEGTLPGSCNPDDPPNLSDPIVQIDQTSVSGMTQQRSVSISFSADQPVEFQCSLDEQIFDVCSSPFSASNLSDGVHNFSVKGVTRDGRTSATAPFSWTIDATAPVLTLNSVSPSEALTTQTSISIDFSSNETAQYSCQLDGADWAACQSPYSLSNLNDGVHVFSVKAQDILGNISDPVSYSWQVKATPPLVSITSIIPAGNLINSAMRYYSFQGDNGAVSYLCQLDNQIAFACNETYQLDNLTEGAHQFSVRAVDSLGQTSEAATDSFTVDLTPPEVIIFSVLPQANPTNSSNLEINFASSEAADLFCSIDGVAQVSCESPLNLADLAEGAHHLQIGAVDLAGNMSSILATYDWTVDQTKPVVSLVSVSPVSSLTNETTMSLAFAINETASSSCRLDQEIPSDCSIGSVFYNNLSNGEHIIHVIATDLAGNIGAEFTYTWTVDNAAPEVQITSVSPPEALTNITTASFSFDSTKTVTFECLLDNGSFVSCSSPFSYSNLTEGTHRFSVRSKDLAGNISQPASYSWIIDVTEPLTSLTSSSVPADAATSMTSATFTFSSNEDNSSFICQLDGLGYQACTSPMNYSGLADGTHRFEVVAIDPAGNPDNSPESVVWTIDSTPIEITNLSVTSITRSSAVISWTTNKPTTSQVAFSSNGVTYTYTAIDSNLVTSHSVTISNLTSLTQYSAYAISSDAFGIQQISSTLTFRTSR